MSRKRTESRTARISDDLEDRLTQVEDDFGYSSAEANRRVWDEGLRSLGYYPRDARPETQLRHVLRQVSVGLGFSGLTIIGLALFAGLEYRLIGFLLVAAALVVRGFDRILGRLEPGVSELLVPNRVRRGDA